MPPESARIIELRRRVESEPGSIAFAQLAEEYRRSGNYEAAVQTCLSGLQRHPAYLSARVTLGRALIEVGKLEEAQAELQTVLRTAPDNLAAIRGLAEIHQRRGDLQPALDYYRRALPLARHDPEIEEAVSQIKRELGALPGAPAASGLSFAQAESELLSALSRMPEAPRPAAGTAAPPPTKPPVQEATAAISSAAPVPVREPRVEGSEQPRVEGSEQPRVEWGERPRVEGRVEAPAPPLAPADKPIDFDLLLQSLGVPLASAPPIVEALLSEPAPIAPRPEPVLPDLPVETVAADPFAELERGLRDFDLSRPPEPAASEPAPVETPAPSAVVDERVDGPAVSSAPAQEPASSPDPAEADVLHLLEAWLAALEAERAEAAGKRPPFDLDRLR